MFARAEKGETIEITRHDKIIATLIPGQQKKRSRIEELEASGALRWSGKTTSDLDTFTQIKVPDVDYRCFSMTAIANEIGNETLRTRWSAGAKRPVDRTRDPCRCSGSDYVTRRPDFASLHESLQALKDIRMVVGEGTR